MIKVKSLQEVSRLAFAHMKPGALTNQVLTPDEYRGDIAGGKMSAYEWPGGVMFLRRRGTYQLLSFVVSDAGSLPDCVLPVDVVCEVAYKPTGAGNAAQAVEFWGRMGLEPVFERIRLARDAAKELDAPTSRLCERSEAIQRPSLPEFPGLPSICLAAPCDFDAVMTLLYACFDRITGHIPDLDELTASIGAEHVLCMKDCLGAVCGLLRWVPRGASVEIRQLALREDMRGKGLVRSLVDAFLECTGGKKTTVWARDGYAPALKSYTAAGFAPDGWRSAVLILPFK